MATNLVKTPQHNNHPQLLKNHETKQQLCVLPGDKMENTPSLNPSYTPFKAPLKYLAI